MADYIERQAVYKKIAEMEETARNRYCDTPWDSPARERYRAQLNERTALKHMIADEPAANVREDVKGEWKQVVVRKPFVQVLYKCTRCGYIVDRVGNFCQNCGARMTK